MNLLVPVNEFADAFVNTNARLEAQYASGMDQQLAGPLAGGVRRDRQDGGFVLGKRRGRCIAVYGRRRAEHDPHQPCAARCIDQTRGRRDVRFHVGAGIVQGRTDARFCRQMDDRLDAVHRHGVVGDIGLDEPKPGKFEEAREVALLDVTRVKRIEVVDTGHRMAEPDERLAHVRADEPGGPGDEKLVLHDSHAPWRVTTSRKYSMVRRSPSSSETFGSHPSVSRACLMSGWRTCGSSTGSGRSTILLLLPVNASTRSASCRTVNSCGLPILVGSAPPRSNSRTMPSIKSST